MAVVLPGEERDAEDQEPDDRRDRAVDPLDPRLVVVERRDQLPVAQRPVGAAHAGVRSPGRSRRSSRAAPSSTTVASGELLEAGHGRGRLECYVGGARVGNAPFYADVPVTGMRRGLPTLRMSRSPVAARRAPRRRLRLVRAATAEPLRRPARPAPRRASVIPVIVSSRQVPGPNRFVFSFLDPKTNLPGRVARPHGLGRVHRARRDRSPGPATEAEFVWAIEGERGDYVANVELGAPGDWKAVFITEAPGSPAGGDRRRLPGVRLVPDGRDRRAGAGHGQPDDRERGLRRQGVHGHRPGPAFYQLTVEGRARREDAVRARVRHAGVLPERAVRPDPRPDQGRRGQGARTTSRSSTWSRTSSPTPRAASSRSSTRTASSSRSSPSTSGASSPSRGCSRSTATGIVQGSFEGVIGEDELTAAIEAISGS